MRNRTCVKKDIRIELDTDQEEVIIQKLEFQARQLNEKIQLYISGASDACFELPTTPEYDQPLVNLSDVFPAPPQATSFQQGSQRNVLLPV